MEERFLTAPRRSLLRPVGPRPRPPRPASPSIQSIPHMDPELNSLLSLCTQLRLKTTNCEISQTDFAAVSSAPEAFAVIRRFWQAIVAQIPELFIQTMAANYHRFKTSANAAGVYFNEPPVNTVNSIVFVGDSPSPVSVMHHRPRVIILGSASVSLADHVRGECFSPNAIVTCFGNSRLTLHRGTAIAHDRSSVIGSGIVHTYDCSSATIMGGELFDHGHLRIVAHNDTVVYSFSRRSIELNDNSKLIIDS